MPTHRLKKSGMGWVGLTVAAPAALKGSIRSLLRLLGVLTVALTVTACAVLKPPPAPRDTFDLTVPQNLAISGSTKAQILVKQPNSLKAIDSDRMILREGTAEITYLAGAQWADNVPKLVQSRLLEAFENAGAAGAAAKPGDGLVIDYQLISEIRRFEIDLTDAPVAVIEISIKLLSDKSGRVLETRIFKARQQATGSEAADYVAALDGAFTEIVRDIINWVTRRV